MSTKTLMNKVTEPEEATDPKETKPGPGTLKVFKLPSKGGRKGRLPNPTCILCDRKGTFKSAIKWRVGHDGNDSSFVCAPCVFTIRALGHDNLDEAVATVMAAKRVAAEEQSKLLVS